MKKPIFLSSLFLILANIELVTSMRWANGKERNNFSEITFLGTQLRDLEYNGEAFVAEASHWYCTSLKKPNNNTYNCNGVYYVGGFNIMGANSNNYFQRTYYTLPAHNQVNISFTQFPMDNNDNPDRLDINIDGTLITGFITDSTNTQAAYATAVCGAAGKDYPPFTATFTHPHTSTTSITIQMIMNLNSNVLDESIAFRDIVIDFVTVANPTSSKCAISSKPLFTSTYACACPMTNQYQNPANSGQCSFCDSTCATCSGSAATQCTSCHPYTDRYYSSNQCLSCYTGCATCTGGGQYQCTSCKTGYYLANDGACYTSCDFPLFPLGDTASPLSPNRCLSLCSSSYLYWDGTCSTSCGFPLTPSTTNSYPTCVYSCAETSYLYWNGSCLSTCPYPLKVIVEKARYFCLFPCSNPADYLLWDGSCSPTCAFALIPLAQVTEGSFYSRKYCRFPCPLSQYLYWNGSCFETCPFPLTERIANSRLFCDFTCTTTINFLYWNGSCTSTCLSPLTQRVEGTPIRYYCDYPCGISTDYLYWNGTCSTCVFPLKARIESENRFCDFPCSVNEFLYWDGTCQPSCDSPLVQDIQGTLNLRKFCHFYCEPNQYLHLNGLCLNKCDYPMSKRYANSRKFCGTPCASNEFLYWNKSCLSSCPLPLSTRIDGNKKYCDYPCSSNSDYLYWNTTCGPCDPPLVKTVVADNNYCDYPCASDEWLYWDNSCNASCPSPPLSPTIQGTPARQICDYPCDLNQFLYWNGSCKDSCNYPLLSVTDKGRHFCHYPCLETEYLFPNRTCASSCSTIFPARTEASRNYCEYPCTDDMMLFYNGTCSEDCPAPYVLNIFSGLRFCDLPCPTNHFWMSESGSCSDTCESVFHKVDTSQPYKICYPSLSTASLVEIETQSETVTFLTLARQMNYMRYLDVGMPERLEKLVVRPGRGIFSFHFGLQLTSSADFSFYKEDFPYIYSRHNIESSLWFGYWQDLITLIIGIGAALFFFIIERISSGEGWEAVELISRRIRVILMWNYVLMVIAWSIDDLILFVAVTSMTLSKQKEAPALTPVSFFLSLLCLCLEIVFIYGAFKIIQKRRHLQPDKVKQFEHQYENCQVLYRGFKDNNMLNQFFFLIYMMRIGLPMFITVLGVKSPLTVSIFQLIINLAMLAYLLVMRPFKKLINQIQLVSYETLVFMMNICVIILAGKSRGSAVNNFRLGDVIIVGNYMINSLAIIFLAIKIYIEAKNLHKDLKGLGGICGKEKVAIYLQLFALFIQQDNMGFEEMIHSPSYVLLKKKSPPNYKKALSKNSNKEESDIGFHIYKPQKKSDRAMDGEGRLINKDTSVINMTTYPEESGFENTLPNAQSYRTYFPQQSERITEEGVSLQVERGNDELAVNNSSHVVATTSLRVGRKKRRINKFALRLENSDLRQDL